MADELPPPLLPIPQEEEQRLEDELDLGCPNEDAADGLISTLYSGPRIQDIEKALSVLEPGNEPVHQMVPLSRITVLERSLRKAEHKYTLKVKNCGNGIGDDGYKWRKYGQKSIKNSTNPRSYYKCTNPKCAAKKQVERSMEDPDTFLITYEGLHLHFTYPFFPEDPAHQPTKKPKRPNIKAQQMWQPPESRETKRPQQATHMNQVQEAQDAQEKSATVNLPEEWFPSFDHRRQQGLLEDVVAPVMKNIPASNGLCSTTGSCSSSSSSSSSCSCSSCRSLSQPVSPSSLTLSPSFCPSYSILGFSDTIL